MPALGLAFAVPRVLGYNFLVRSNRAIAGKFESFAHDLESFFVIGQKDKT